jgi:hypothetical protein
MSHDAVTAGTLLLLAAFAIDRTASGITFLFWRPRGPAADLNAAAAWNQKIFYFAVASILAILVLAMTTKVRVLAGLGLLPEQAQPGIDAWVDRCITFVVLVGGADRLSGLLSSSGGHDAPAAPDPPIEVRGTLTLYDAEGAPARLPDAKRTAAGH